MSKVIGLLLALSLLAPSAISEKRWKVPAENFDGSRFASRYSLDKEDFHAEYVDGEMWIVLSDDVIISDTNPIFEASDTTKQDRLAVFRAKMGRSEDLTVAELNEYLRLTAGL